LKNIVDEFERLRLAALLPRHRGVPRNFQEGGFWQSKQTQVANFTVLKKRHAGYSLEFEPVW